jgi:methylated-DNA-[protein]-cysteine S-methyltransferase
MSTIHETPLGPVVLTASYYGLTACSFDLAKRPTRSDESTALANRWRQIAARDLDEYFTGERKVGVAVDLHKLGEFEIRLYGALSTIDYGRTVTAGELASLAGFGAAAGWLVAETVRRNPVQLLVPSHRVVDGRGAPLRAGRGDDLADALLDLEQRSSSTFSPPTGPSTTPSSVGAGGRVTLKRFPDPAAR